MPPINSGITAKLNLTFLNGYVITIRQSIQQRIALNRSIEGMEVDGYDDQRVYVYKLTFIQALEKAYELFGSQKPRQMDLFDFLAA